MPLVHPEHEEADEDEGAEEGKQVEAMPGEVESLKSPVLVFNWSFKITIAALVVCGSGNSNILNA